jgi:hypothetical protein
MISEASKREKIANAVLGATFALSAAQSPQDFVKTGKIESPGAALMQTWGRKRGEAERNLDSGRVSHPARNRKIKEMAGDWWHPDPEKDRKLGGPGANQRAREDRPSSKSSKPDYSRSLMPGETYMQFAKRKEGKTFREFIEEAYLYEMRKEDKVAGRKKTPLILPVTSKHARKDESGNWKVEKLVTHRANPEAQMGRFKQGKGMPGDAGHHHYSTEGGTGGGPGFGYRPQPHGTGGELRGVKKKDQPTEYQGRTPAQKVADKRKKAAYKGYNYGRRW